MSLEDSKPRPAGLETVLPSGVATAKCNPKSPSATPRPPKPDECGGVQPHVSSFTRAPPILILGCLSPEGPLKPARLWKPWLSGMATKLRLHAGNFTGKNSRAG